MMLEIADSVTVGYVIEGGKQEKQLKELNKKINFVNSKLN